MSKQSKLLLHMSDCLVSVILAIPHFRHIVASAISSLVKVYILLLQ